MADEAPKTDDSRGGQGDGAARLLPSQANERRDLRMLERAIKQKWNIDDRAFAALPTAMLAIALDAKREDRSRIAAARVITTMHGQNQDEGKPAGDQHLHLHNEQTLVVNDFSGLTNEQLRHLDELCDLAEHPSATPAEPAAAEDRPASAEAGALQA